MGYKSSLHLSIDAAGCWVSLSFLREVWPAWWVPPYTLSRRSGHHNPKEIILSGGEQSFGPCLAKKSEAVGTSCADCVAQACGFEEKHGPPPRCARVLSGGVQGPGTSGSVSHAHHLLGRQSQSHDSSDTSPTYWGWWDQPGIDPASE